MPLYSDANYYYSGGSSQLFAPYYPSGVYSIPSVSSAYAPYSSSTYSRPISSSYLPSIPKTPRSPTYSTHGLSSRYQPKLSTIGETSTLMTSSRHSALLPLTRMHSPKIKSYSTASSTTLHSKYIPPRPININTADIDVSSARHRRQTDEILQRAHLRQAEIISKEATAPAAVAAQTATKSETDSLKNEVDSESANAEETEKTESKHMRSTIRRNRPVVRLSTVRARNKDTKIAQQLDVTQKQQMTDQVDSSEEKIGWRQKLADDLALLAPNQTKKSPGQRLRERFLIKDTKSNENMPEIESEETKRTKESEELMEEVVVQVDAVNQICHVSVPGGPTFHDICADISSDKIDDDLNAGALRKRASIIMEQEVELLNQLQQSASGTFQLIHLERRSSHDSINDEPHEIQRTSKRLSKDKKKIKHKITAIVDIQNAPLTPIMQERDEELSPLQKISPKPKITYNLDHVDEHHQINKVLKLPKKKSVKRSLNPKIEDLPTGFLEPLANAKRASKSSKHYKSHNTAKIFTFSQESIDKQREIDEEKISKKEQKIPEECVDKSKSESERKIEKENKKTATVEDNKNVTKQKDIVLNKKTLINENDDSGKKENLKIGEIKLKTSSSMGTVQKTNTTATVLKSSKSLDSAKSVEKTKEEPQTPIKKIVKPVKEISKEKSDDNQPAVATPKPIRKVVKSDSSEDFWSYIGTRETVYMANRKNILQEIIKPRVEMMAEPSKVSDDFIKHNLQSNKMQMAHSMDTIEETTLPKVEIMKEPLKISEPIEKHNLQNETKQIALKKELATKTSLPKVEIMKEPLSISERHKDNIKDDKQITKAKNLHIGISEQSKNIQSLKKETNESSLKVIEITRAKSEEPDNKQNTTCIVDKIPMPSTATKSTSETIIPKIQTGKIAKSPEIKDKLQKSSSNTIIAISTTTTTTKTTTTSNTKTTIFNEDINKIKTKNANLATTKTTTTITTQPKILSNISTITATKATIGDALTTQTKLATTTTTTTTKAITTMATKECIAEVDNKMNALTTKLTKMSERSDSPLKNNVINKANMSPINADGFITVAPLKSITTTNVSPTKANNKNASPVKKTTTIENSTKITDKVTMTTTKATSTNSTIMATKMTTSLSTSTSTTTIANTVAASNQTAEIPATTSAITMVATTETTEATKTTSDTSDGGNNLSKFATVLDLAQCLRDVDADLEDYIPSSAENSSDEDNLSDDSTFYCSSVDGCENLSASMKKKLKEKKRKEKQAQKVRFDPQKKVKIDTHNKCYVKEEAPRFPLVATPRPLWKREKIVYPDESSEDSDNSDEESASTEETEDSEECTSNSEEEYDNSPSSTDVTTGSSLASTNDSSIIRLSTCSNDSGFEGGTAPSSPKKMLGECKINAISMYICNNYFW